MADKKISQLTAATIPLVGTEPVPLVQSGNTVKATAQNIANLAIPSQTGQGGKYLTTDGTTASWASVTSGQNFKTYAAVFSLSGGSVTTTELYNDTGVSINLITSLNSIIVNAGATPVFTTNKTFVTCGNLLLSAPSVAFMANVSLNTTFLQLFYYTTAGAAQNLTVATTSPQLVLVQIYP
jgi:hypothetical protein